MRLVLVGAGHAHLFVLQALAERPIAGLQTTLVAPAMRAHYSGMIPGFLTGTYTEDQLSFDVPALARAAGATLLLGAAERVDGVRRIVAVAGNELEFDVASLNVGSVVSGLDVPGVREHAIALRPLERASELRARIDALSNPAVAIVGGGAAGVEVSLAIARRLRDRGEVAMLTLVERGATILAGYSPRVQRLGRRALERAAITIVQGAVASVDAEGVSLESGARIPSALTVWLAGAAAPPLLGRSVLPLRDGFFAVDETLRAENGVPVFGAGDCISLAGSPDLPKAGVFAVREGPLLARNIRAALEKSTAYSYSPQKNWLAILNTADGKAILRWHALVMHSRAAWLLKDRIDRGFISRFGSGAKAAIPPP